MGKRGGQGHNQWAEHRINLGLVLGIVLGIGLGIGLRYREASRHLRAITIVQPDVKCVPYVVKTVNGSK